MTGRVSTSTRSPASDTRITAYQISRLHRLWVEPWCGCANCLGKSTGGDPVPLDDIFGGANEPVL